MTALEARKVEIEAKIRDSAAPSPVHLHPNLPSIYKTKVEALEAALNETATRPEAGEIMRSLIDRIVLRPADEGMAAELHGDLAGILAMCGDQDHKRQLPDSGEPGSQLSVVAGARSDLCRTTLRR
ncbi:MAG: hypothetical protein O3A96_17430 [Proteobacteria bacterium]|nr:hypothetical protein [Pseudomonadota bacterium]